jgi:SAM-dependent methyltransferase
MTFLRRPLGSYAKVQALVGSLVRNRRFQLGTMRVRGLKYLDLGCGANLHEDFINLDFLWRPGVDGCWDIARGLPFASRSMRGVFSEHCLEHFSLPAAIEILKECRRILASGAILRIVVPDGEKYLSTYSRQLSGDASSRFPFQDQDVWQGKFSPILSVNRIFYWDRDSPHGHRFMYDFHLLQTVLLECGFRSVSRTAFAVGTDPVLLIDSASRAEESLYLEAAA